ncbi:MAG: response regulator [Vicinamibacterales bacterium]|nr:response regulator [Vicinamibacterales bacterium]
MSPPPTLVLLVEDDAAHVELVRRAFDRSDPPVQLHVARTADEALRAFDERRPALVLSDYRLPGAAPDWWRVCANRAPVIVMTAFGNEHAAVDVLKAGAADYVVKSSDAFGRLPMVVARVLREWGYRRQQERSDALLRALVEQSREGVVLVRRDGAIVLANPWFASLTGRPLQELVGGSLATVLQAEVDVPAALERTLRGRGGVFEAELRSLEGEIIPIEVAAQPVELDGERLALGLIRDIRERVAARGERARLEEQLQQSQKMEAMGTLAGGIAHDFNNLLFAITGYAEMARHRIGGSHPAARDLQALLAAADRASGLVRQILSFARRQDASRQVLDLGSVVREALRLLRATLPAGVDLRSRLDDPLPPAAVDPSQIQQVLLNLCTNAWHALPDGRGTITVTLTEAPAAAGAEGAPVEGRTLCLSVIDTGAGIDSALLPRIFDPFVTSKPAGSGTGLGLAIVDRVVRAHEGRVEVESTPGVGTTFRVHLPAVATSASEPAPAPEAARGHGQRVLYVDDEHSLVTMVGALLRQRGFDVIGCTTPGAALEIWRTASAGIDVVLTDLNMPLLSGLDVAEVIRGGNTEIPIIMMSGFMTEAQAARARTLGVTLTVDKPVSPDGLARAINVATGHGA